MFTSGKLPALIITTNAGAQRLREQSDSASVDIRVIRGSTTAIPASAILVVVCRVRPAKRILVEGGPRLLGDFYAEQLIDEQFLTLGPRSPAAKWVTDDSAWSWARCSRRAILYGGP